VPQVYPTLSVLLAHGLQAGQQLADLDLPTALPESFHQSFIWNPEQGLRLLVLLPTANIIYLLDMLARKLNFYTSRPAKILRPANFPGDLIRITLHCCQSED
jgi:hypothetical protein